MKYSTLMANFRFHNTGNQRFGSIHLPDHI